MIYLDHAASCPLTAAARQAFLEVPYGNPNSNHPIGYQVLSYLIKAKEIIAECIGCKTNEVYFTSGATEACAWAIKIMENLCSNISYKNDEHNAVLLPCKNQNCHGTKQGITRMLVNNVLGTIYPIPKKTNNNIIFCDGTAAIGHISFNFTESNIDMLAFGGHKFGAPLGIGCLIIKEGIEITPLLMSEHGARGGTPAPALAYSMAIALKESIKNLDQNNQYYLQLKSKILNNIECNNNSAITGNYAPYNLNISFKNTPGYLLVETLNNYDICVTTGSACSDITAAPIDIFLTNGLSSELAKTSIRITLGEENTFEEIQIFIDIIQENI